MNSAKRDLRHLVTLSDAYQFNYLDTDDIMIYANSMKKFANEYNEICDQMKRNDTTIENAVTGTTNKVHAKAQSITSKARTIFNDTKVDGYTLDNEKLAKHLFDKSQTINYQRTYEARARVERRLNIARTQNNATEITKCQSDMAKIEQALRVISGYANSAYTPRSK